MKWFRETGYPEQPWLTRQFAETALSINSFNPRKVEGDLQLPLPESAVVY
jgi:hypothetical protein